ncbi:MAG: FKBP-type peptidyl-prolyl cis-trans isomerase [Ferruginibacter sp.]
MIRKLLTFFICCVVLSSCKKDDNSCPYTVSGVVVPASEIANLQTYITANHPTAIQHPGGFFYEINAAGTGTVTPTVCSTISVTYAGYLTNGFKFDESITPVSFPLGRVIVGWQRGVPLVKKGGSINLYLPPSLGYGSNAVGSIPPNSILIFTIQLVDVQ